MLKKSFHRKKKKENKKKISVLLYILISYYYSRRKEGLENAFLQYKRLTKKDSTGWGQSLARKLLGGPYWKHPSMQAHGSHPYNWSGDAREQAPDLL